MFSALVAPLAAQAAVSSGDIVYTDYSTYQIGFLHAGTRTNLSNNSYSEQNAEVSPDGSRIAYISQRPKPGGGTQRVLCVMNSDGSGQTQIDGFQTGDYVDWSPRWSPDGQTIAFTRVNNTTGYYNLYSIPATGGNRFQLTTDNISGLGLGSAWSSNGSKIVYNSGRYTLKIMDANGSNSRDLVAAGVKWGGQQFLPAWSPDGSRIYFATGGGIRYYSSTDGFATSTNVSASAQLETPAPYTFDNQPTVSANGSTIAFSRNNLLYSVGSGGGTPTQLTTTGNQDEPSYVKAAWAIKKFAVLGDSFSSGEGNPTFLSGTDTSTDKCHRSNAAYAKWLNSHPVGLSLTAFVACSQATTTLVSSGSQTESSQLLAPASTDDYVILTVGGNDAQFKEFATDCVLSNCDGSTQDTTTQGLVTNTLPDNLDTLFGDLASAVAGTSTRVLVLGYPYILPTDTSGINCFYLSSAERTEATNVQIGIDGAIHSAVTRAGSPFEYVDPNATGSPFEGHELCSSGTYFNGLDTVNQVYSFHPNADGQAAYAKVITDYLAAHPS